MPRPKRSLSKKRYTITGGGALPYGASREDYIWDNKDKEYVHKDTVDLAERLPWTDPVVKKKKKKKSSKKPSRKDRLKKQQSKHKKTSSKKKKTKYFKTTTCTAKSPTVTCRKNKNKICTGPRGGKFYLSKSGLKVYCKK